MCATLLERKVTELDNLRRELRGLLDSWETSSQRRGVVCQHIEGKGGDTSWKGSRSALPARLARKSSSRATIRIGEDENTVVLQKAEWNVLVDAIKSGQLGRV